MRAALGLLLAAALPLVPAPVQAAVEAAETCELHIWPTGSINAVDKDNNLTLVDGGIGVESSYTAVEGVARSIAAAIGPARQLELIRAFPLKAVPQFARHELVFHDGEVSPPDYPTQWLNKGFAEGQRLSTSQSLCYAELHVMFVTYMDQPLKDTLHTIFVLRYFAAQSTTIAAAADGGYHKTDSIVWGGADQDEVARASLAAAFTENLTKFFKRRKIKRILEQM